jgi:hypothetical protein
VDGAGSADDLHLAVSSPLQVPSPSAHYRCLADRDELLTALIIDAQNELGLTNDETEAAFDGPISPSVGGWPACPFAAGHSPTVTKTP